MSEETSDESKAARKKRKKKGRKKSEKAISKQDVDPHEELVEEPEASSSSKASGAIACSIAPTSSTSTVADTDSPTASSFLDSPTTSSGFVPDLRKEYNIVYSGESESVSVVRHLDDETATQSEVDAVKEKLHYLAERHKSALISKSLKYPNTEERPIWVPCYDPSQPHQTEDDDAIYVITMRNPRESDLITVWDTNAEIQALCELKEREGLQPGLDMLRKFAAEFDNSSRFYRDAYMAHLLEEREAFIYEIKYGEKKEYHDPHELRRKIVDQIPGYHTFTSTKEAARSKLRTKLHDMQQKRKHQK